MDKIDYIIVGLGIAGISICEQLRKNNKSFVVIDAKSSATSVAGGVVNPCVLKRFNPVWNANPFFEYAFPFYKNLEAFISQKIVLEATVLKIFTSIEDQNNWIVGSDKKELEKYLSSTIVKNDNEGIQAPFNFGELKSTFQLNTKLLIEKYTHHLRQIKSLLEEAFDYKKLCHNKKEVTYKSIIANKIVFAQGVSALQNPYFPKDILHSKKGEYITIKATDLKCNSVLKGKYFIIPQGNDLYKVGATFDHKSNTHIISEKGKNELVGALKKMISVPFQMVDQEVGMRPTVLNKRPIVGNLPNHDNIYFLNGLGTHGLLMAPLLSKNLYDFMENKVALPSEINIKRFFN